MRTGSSIGTRRGHWRPKDSAFSVTDNGGSGFIPGASVARSDVVLTDGADSGSVVLVCVAEGFRLS